MSVFDSNMPEGIGGVDPAFDKTGVIFQNWAGYVQMGELETKPFKQPYIAGLRRHSPATKAKIARAMEKSRARRYRLSIKPDQVRPPTREELDRDLILNPLNQPSVPSEHEEKILEQIRASFRWG